jgi:hypothetical protein
MNAFRKTVLILCGSVFIFPILQPAWRTPITSPEAALQRLESEILPAIEVQTAAPITMDPTITTASALTAADRLPAVEAFPLYGGDALPQNPGNAVLRIEIVSSVEKADGRHPENRWLVDVAERFNQRRERIGGGPPIEVVVRAIPSGLGAQMLAAGKMRPAAYSPAGQSWLELLRHQGLTSTLISDKLVANTTRIHRWLPFPGPQPKSGGPCNGLPNSPPPSRCRPWPGSGATANRKASLLLPNRPSLMARCSVRRRPYGNNARMVAARCICSW